jgi:hypothetical protein
MKYGYLEIPDTNKQQHSKEFESMIMDLNLWDMWNEVVSQPLIPSELSASFENDSNKKIDLRKGFCTVPCTRGRCTRLAGRRWTGWDQTGYQ